MKKGATFFSLIALWAFSSTQVAVQAKPLLTEPVTVYSDTILLDEVQVVSANKTAVERNQIPFPVSVVDREVLEQSVQTGILSLLSEEVPGLFVTQKGVTGFGISEGSAGTVNIHGVGGGNKVLMLIDGQPMWAGIFGHSVADVYVTSDAERVEVIRGPASLLYGSNAMGGVVNVITRSASEEGFHGRGRIQYGSYDTQKYALNGGYKEGKFKAYASLNRDQTDGKRDRSEFYLNNGYLKLSYDFSEKWTVKGDAIVAHFKTVNPGAVGDPIYDNWSKATRATYSLSLDNRYERLNGSVQLYYNTGNHKIDDGYRPGEQPQMQLFRSDDFVRGLAVYESIRLFDGNLLTTGLDWKQWGGHAWYAGQDGSDTELVDKRVDEVAGYLVVQQVIADRFTLNAGVRMENNGTYGNSWMPQAGLAYRPGKGTTLKASFARGFRSPNLRELYMFVPANPDLQPERMVNYDITWQQSFCGDRGNFELSAYFAKGKNLISREMVEGKPKNINTGKFIHKGVDFGAHYRFGRDVKVSGNYSYLLSDILLPAAPKHQAFARLDWNVGRFLLQPSVQYVGGLYLEMRDQVKRSEEYLLFNLKSFFRINKSWSLFLTGENLTDSSYETYAGFPMPGIILLGGVDFRF